MGAFDWFMLDSLVVLCVFVCYLVVIGVVIGLIGDVVRRILLTIGSKSRDKQREVAKQAWIEEAVGKAVEENRWT